jgi:hypothetical protein
MTNRTAKRIAAHLGRKYHQKWALATVFPVSVDPREPQDARSLDSINDIGPPTMPLELSRIPLHLDINARSLRLNMRLWRPSIESQTSISKRWSSSK